MCSHLAPSSTRLLRHRPFRFLVAGGTATLLHWLVLTGGVVAGMAPLTATVLGSVLGALANYVLQHRWVFGAARPHRQALWRYGMSCALATVLNALLFAAVHHGLGWSPLPAQIATTALVAVLNYGFYKIWVFHEQAG